MTKGEEIAKAWGCQGEQAASFARDIDKAIESVVQAMLKETTSEKNGMVCVRMCMRCRREYPEWSVSSHMRCWECRMEAGDPCSVCGKGSVDPKPAVAVKIENLGEITIPVCGACADHLRAALERDIAKKIFSEGLQRAVRETLLQAGHGSPLWR